MGEFCKFDSDNRKFRLRPSEKHKSSGVRSHRKSDQGSDFILGGRGSSQVTHPGYMNNSRAICPLTNFAQLYTRCNDSLIHKVSFISRVKKQTNKQTKKTVSMESISTVLSRQSRRWWRYVCIPAALREIIAALCTVCILY